MPQPPASDPSSTDPLRSFLRRHQARQVGLASANVGLFLVCVVLLLALVIWSVDEPVFSSLWLFFQKAVGTRYGWVSTLRRALMLACCAWAIALSFRAGLFNIGAEGQMVAGMMGAGCAALVLIPAWLPWWIALPAVLLSGMLAGALWSMLAGALKIWCDVSEVISTLMLNFIALGLLKYLVSYPYLFQNPEGTMNQSQSFAANVCIQPWADTSFHSGVFWLIPLTLLMYSLLYWQKWGWAVRAIGSSPDAAAATGLNITRTRWQVFAYSGAIAGLGGALGVLAFGYLPENLYRDYGYTAIAVALVAQLHPLAIPLSALLFGALAEGAQALDLHTDVPREIVYLIQGLVILQMLWFSWSRFSALPEAPPTAPVAPAAASASNSPSDQKG